MTSRIVVDDSDVRIRYIGSGWSQDISGSQDGFGTYGTTYNRTLHVTQSNDSLSFSFQGVAIRVLGTIDLPTTRGGPAVVTSPSSQLPWECFIDGVSIGSSQPSPYHENNWILCDSEDLNDGAHQLTLNVNTTLGNFFRVDQLQYTTTQLPLDGAVVLLDDTDPALSYDSNWQKIDGIASITTTQGSRVTFTFTGTQLTWVGYIPVELPGNQTTASYSIDNGPPTPFSLDGHPPTDGTSTFNQIFFTTPQLVSGPHSIVVTYNGNSQKTPLTLDYVYLRVGGQVVESGHKNVITAAVCGSVGAVVTIALIAIAIWLWKRRQIKRSSAVLSTTSSWFIGRPTTSYYPYTYRDSILPRSPAAAQFWQSPLAQNPHSPASINDLSPLRNKTVDSNSLSSMAFPSPRHQDSITVAASQNGSMESLDVPCSLKSIDTLSRYPFV